MNDERPPEMIGYGLLKFQVVMAASAVETGGVGLYSRVQHPLPLPSEASARRLQTRLRMYQGGPPVKAFMQTLKNKPFLVLVGSFLITSGAFTLLTTLLPYYLKYQLGMEDQMSFVMLALLVTIGLFLYPMKMVADRIGKGKAYALGLAIASVAIFVGFFIPAGPTPLIYAIAIVTGIGLSAQWVCPWSMVPDVIEIDEAATGERREGIYYGMWNFITKFANAFAIASAGWMLTAFGYMPDVPQTDFTLLGIRILFCLVPVALFVLTMPILIKYPITSESHAKLVEELRARLAAPSA